MTIEELRNDLTRMMAKGTDPGAKVRLIIYTDEQPVQADVQTTNGGSALVPNVNVIGETRKGAR